MTGPPGVDLGRQRDAPALIGESLVLLWRHLPTFLAISLAIVVPVQLVVSGIGLEELTGPYREGADAARGAIDFATNVIVISPLVTAGTIYALGAVAAGNRPRAGQSIQAAVEAFTPLFLAVLIAAAGIALGLLLLIVPGIYVAVRWYFTVQAVIVEEARGIDALKRSASIVEDSWFRTAGIVLLANVVALVPAFLILAPVSSLAEAADSQAVVLGGEVLVQSIATPFVALASTLLYYDLRVRRERSVV